VYPTLSEYHHYVGNISKNLFALQPSADYIDDMKLYLMRYRSLRYGANIRIRSWSNLYSKLMRDMAKADPTIDLISITREYIYAHNLPCISVKKAVEAGLLPVVHNWQSYDHEL
jgi:hypothetical protein